MRSWIAALVVAMLVVAVGLTWAPTGALAQDAEALERQIATVQAAACEAQARLCAELKAFADAGIPCLPEGGGLSVGHAYLIGDDGSVQPAEYFVLRTQRAGELTLVQTQHVFSENAEEKEAAEALIAGIAGGVVDEANPLYRYLAKSGGQAPQLLAQPEQRSLVVRAEGPVIFLRQSGKQIYAVLPDTVVVRPDSGQRQTGLLFSVLPALAACE